MVPAKLSVFTINMVHAGLLFTSYPTLTCQQYLFVICVNILPSSATLIAHTYPVLCPLYNSLFTSLLRFLCLVTSFMNSITSSELICGTLTSCQLLNYFQFNTSSNHLYQVSIRRFYPFTIAISWPKVHLRAKTASRKNSDFMLLRLFLSYR